MNIEGALKELVTGDDVAFVVDTNLNLVATSITYQEVAVVDNTKIAANNASVPVVKRVAQFYEDRSEGYAYNEAAQIEVGGVLWWFQVCCQPKVSISNGKNEDTACKHGG